MHHVIHVVLILVAAAGIIGIIVTAPFFGNANALSLPLWIRNIIMGILVWCLLVWILGLLGVPTGFSIGM